MKPKYITPRIAIVTLNETSHLNNLKAYIQTTHKLYFHLFNLTNVLLPPQNVTTFKWRGLPFSVTEALRMLTQIDTFLRINIANTVFICVADKQMQEYALITFQCYVSLCIQNIKQPKNIQTIKQLANFSQQMTSIHPYFHQQIIQIYKQVRVDNPPVKILEWLTVQPQQAFIPLIQIWNEGRYNDFQLAYTHSVQTEVSEYYLSLNSPLHQGIGQHYYDQKPETKYFHYPIVVYGDVKIIVYSYKTLKKIHELTVGFNTLGLADLTQGEVLELSQKNFYERRGQLNQQLTLKIKFADYCENVKCKRSASCIQCKQASKKLANRYGEVQRDLQRLHRKRSCNQVTDLLSINIF